MNSTIAVEGIRLGRTGHREKQTIQSFNATRQRWSELRIGAFKDDWETLLSKLRPTPKYPRPEPSLPAIAWVILVIAGLCAAYAILVKFPRMVSSG